MNDSQKIDEMIGGFDGWRGETLARLRKIINDADPNLKEEWKWNTAVWTNNGMVCAISGFKNHVKLNLFKGSQLDDPLKQINAGFESKGHRGIDFHEGDKINDSAVQDLIRQAVSINN